MTVKLRKKIPAILLALLLLVACGGCGSAPAEEPQQEESTAASTEAETKTEPAEQAEQPADKTSSEEEPEATDSAEPSEAKPKAEEPASTDSTESAAPPKYLVDYLGMTIGEIADIWGEDYTLLEGDWNSCNPPGLCYDDNRTPLLFSYGPPTDKIENNKICRVELPEPDSEATLWIEEGVPCHVTLTDLKKLDLNNAPDDIVFDESNYWYNINEHIGVSFVWDSVYESQSFEPAYTEYPTILVGYNS